MEIIKKYDSIVDALYISIIRNYDKSIFRNVKLDYTYCFDNRISFYLNFDINNENDICWIEIIGANLWKNIDKISFNQEKDYILFNFSDDLDNKVINIFKNIDLDYENEYILNNPWYKKNIFWKLEVWVWKLGELCYIIIYS